MEDTKIGFFQQIQYAIYKPQEYYKLSKVKGGRLAGFVFLLVLITSIFSVAIPLFMSTLGSNGAINKIYNNAPDFHLRDGEFYISTPYENTDNNSYILLDSNVDYFDTSDIDRSFNDVVLVSKNNMVTYSNGETQTINLSTLSPISFEKANFLKLKPLLTVFIIFAFVIAYIFITGWYFLSSLFYSLFGMVVSNFTKADLSFGTLFRIAVYSKVTIKILYAIFDLIKLNIPGNLGNIVAILVTCTYVTLGVKSHTTKDESLDL